MKHRSKQLPIRIGLSAGPEPLKLSISGTCSVDRGARTITGTVTVFNVHSSSQGIKLMPGSLTPREPIKRVKLLRDHDLAQPVGYMSEYTADGDRIKASYKVAEGADGDKALDDAEQGLRDGFSVGFIANEYTFDDNYNLIVHAAEWFETSLVAVPDFQDAQVESVALSAAKQKANPMRFTAEQIAAFKANGLTDAQIATLQAQQDTPPAAPAAPAADLGTQAPAAAGNAPVTNGSVQLAAADEFPQAGSISVKARPMSLLQVARKVSAAVATGDPTQIQLALADVVPADDAGEGWGLREGWMGEVWAAANTGRPWITALGQIKPLTTMELRGWQWDVRPKVGKYSGNKTEVPTNKPKTKPVTGAAGRWAGGWDIDRIFIDLGDPAFLTSFWTAAAAEYDVSSDEDIATQLLAAATDKGVSTSAVAAIAGIAADLRKIGATASSIFLAEDVFDEYADLKQGEVPFWLANATGVSLAQAEAQVADLKISVDVQLDAGQVVGFDRRAADVYEKNPIKLQAQDIARGGVDLGFFSYGGLVINDARAIITRTVGAGV